MKPPALLLSLAFADPPAEEATKLAGDGRYADAVQKFVEAITRDPKNASLHLSLGLAYQSLKKYPEAAQALEKAAELNPTSPDPFYSLGLLYEAAATDPAPWKEPKTDAVRNRFWLKARKAWETFLGLTKDPKKAEIAKRHLERISEALK